MIFRLYLSIRTLLSYLVPTTNTTNTNTSSNATITGNLSHIWFEIFVQILRRVWYLVPFFPGFLRVKYLVLFFPGFLRVVGQRKRPVRALFSFNSIEKCLEKTCLCFCGNFCPRSWDKLVSSLLLILSSIIPRWFSACICQLEIFCLI